MSDSIALDPVHIDPWFRTGGYGKARRLANQLWSGVDPSEIIIKPMRGGSYNRVVSVQVRDKKYVIRIPKESQDTGGVDITADIAPLLFLENHTDISAAIILTFCNDTNSPIELPFMVQERVKGHCLYDTYDGYSQDIRRRVAKDLGKLYSQLLSLKSSTAGRVAIPSNSKDLNATVLLAPFPHLYPPPFKVREVMEADVYDPKADTTPSKSISEFLTSVISTQSWAWEERHPHDNITKQLFSKYTAMLEDMEHKGYFKSVGYSFCHLDLFPRNIMFDANADASASGLTGLDWDSALFVPNFMMCTPPSWLWDEYVHVEGVTANPNPSTKIGHELKQIFEDAAGPVYKHFADSDVYRLARRLCFEVLIYGVGKPFTENRVQCETTLREWERRRWAF